VLIIPMSLPIRMAATALVAPLVAIGMGYGLDRPA
jgi:hypothetical protein